MTSASEPLGTLEVALGHAERLLDRHPALAAEQAEEILRVAPGHPHARLIVAKARRLAPDVAAALAILEPLAREQPNAAAVHLELGVARGDAGDARAAADAFRRVLQLKPDFAEAWRRLADVLDLAGDAAGADQARARFLKAATGDPRLIEAGAALVANDLPVAEARLRQHLLQHPTDVAALRMLAEVAGRLRRYHDAETLLARCLELAPSFDGARHNYAMVLHRQAKSAAALPEVERLLAREPRNPAYRNLHAAILASLGDYPASVRIYEEVLAQYPEQPKIWMSYGHSLKTSGRIEECIAAYRRSIAMLPTLGEAYWSLANLKTYRFSAEDRGAMQAALLRTDLDADDRLHFEFALGKALEDAAEWEASFDHYARGNALRHRQQHYRREENTEFLRRSEALLTAEFFAARRGAGCPAPDPIFILGLPRSGSTLLEQILSSHSLVEGTMELPDIPMLVRELDGRAERDDVPGYPQALAALSPAALAALGERYLAATRVQRKTPAPFFVDKMPNNCLHVGLIHLILPNARIIDARRHPMGCCFSAFKQHFARGQSFSYDLADVGAYYRDYVELMAHIDAVLPGRVHRVIYERLVADTEGEVRRLLDYCGLPFEDGCLRFYENGRAVRTASSEQVRRPIFRDGLDHWRHYEPWLGPLRDALGPVLDLYPEVPAFGRPD